MGTQLPGNAPACRTPQAPAAAGELLGIARMGGRALPGQTEMTRIAPPPSSGPHAGRCSLCCGEPGPIGALVLHLAATPGLCLAPVLSSSMAPWLWQGAATMGGAGQPGIDLGTVTGESRLRSSGFPRPRARSWRLCPGIWLVLKSCSYVNCCLRACLEARSFSVTDSPNPGPTQAGAIADGEGVSAAPGENKGAGKPAHGTVPQPGEPPQTEEAQR